MTQRVTVWDFTVSDSVQVERGISEWDSKGLVVRCADCHHDHCSYLKPIRTQEGDYYENYYRYYGSVRKAAPFFCEECYEELGKTKRESDSAIQEYF